MKKQIWLTSTNEEHWSGSEEYSSKEEAIINGAEEHGLDPEDGFYIGTKESFVLTPSSGENLIENMICDNEELGDYSESWQNAVMGSKEVEAYANKKIQEVCDYIMKKHPPSFFIVGNVESVSADDSYSQREKERVAQKTN